MSSQVCYDNHVNDNKFNDSKLKSSKIMKKLMKPLLDLLHIKSAKHNTYKKSPQPQFYQDEDEEADNLANELLENEIFEEIDDCDEFSAVSVYRNGHMDILPVFRGQRYIPVHFARTQAGTFFWTSMVGADCDVSCHGDQNAITNYQKPELQVPAFRWAQA